MKYIPTMIAIVCLASLPNLSARPATEYSVDSVAGIVGELHKPDYEKPVKEWLKINRPAQYEKMFGEKANEDKTDKDKPQSKGLLSALVELNAAVSDGETFLIDYYINYKAKEGWIVVSLTDKMILFRRDQDAKGEQGGAPNVR